MSNSEQNDQDIQTSKIQVNLDSFKIEEKSSQKQKLDAQDGAFSIGVGAAVGATTSAVVGGAGLAVAGTGVAIGMAPVAVAGAVVGSAVYGVQKAIEKQDPTAIGAVVVGASAGAGVSAVVGGMGLAVAGTAVGIGMAPIAAIGGIIGLAGYGLFSLFGGDDKKKEHDQKVGEWANWHRVNPYDMGAKNYQRCLYDVGLGGEYHELEFNEDGSLKYQ